MVCKARVSVLSLRCRAFRFLLQNRGLKGLLFPSPVQSLAVPPAQLLFHCVRYTEALLQIATGGCVCPVRFASRAWGDGPILIVGILERKQIAEPPEGEVLAGGNTGSEPSSRARPFVQPLCALSS